MRIDGVIAPGAPGVRTRDVAATHDGWRTLYLLGGVAAFLALAGMLFDIGLSMAPGWGTGTVPAGAAQWLAQFATDPLLGMRNLDFLNIVLSVLSLPMYAALAAALRREQPGLAWLGLVVVAVGTTLFVAANAALPMLDVSRRFAAASADPAARAALLASAESLLARGAHGSTGAFPGFFVSELGTLLVATAMLRGRTVFGRAAGWIGTIGTLVLIVYTCAYTFATGADVLVKAVAIPGGLLMIAWHAMVGTRLLRLARVAQAAPAPSHEAPGAPAPSASIPLPAV